MSEQYVSELENAIESLKMQALSSLQPLVELPEIEAWRVRHFGRSGFIKEMKLKLKAQPDSLKPKIGKALNLLEEILSKAIQEKLASLNEAQLQIQLREETVDVSLPSKPIWQGSLHPVTHTIERIASYFSRLGFIVTEGPEIEDSYHNFDALNVPKNHPARAESDTFWFNETTLLRTHTSGVQIRTMQKQKPPLRILSPGRVYRRDSDQTHTPMFHQVEGLLVEPDVTFSDLKGIIEDFILYFFEDTVTDIRFRPSFFPFTEPSAEVDIRTNTHQWLEVLGCGMVHPNVFHSVGFDSKKCQGFAFGLGVERFAMLRYGISDLRTFFENDVRFLRQLSM